MAKALMTSGNPLGADYDGGGDVLYLTYGAARPGFGDYGDEDLVFRFAEDDHSPIGVTVIGYNAAGWADRKSDLARSVAKHLHLNPVDVLVALKGIGL